MDNDFINCFILFGEMMAIIKFDYTNAKRVIREMEEAKMLIACEIVEAEAKNLCPVDKGNLIGSFSHEVDVSNSEIIGRVKNSSSYAAAVEFGTKPHVIEPKNKKALSFKIDGKWVTVKKVNHPGTQGIPFLRGAMISKKLEVKEILDLQ
jgi:HK97 gp10 family phage protein